jgi:hypothetical protein
VNKISRIRVVTSGITEILLIASLTMATTEAGIPAGPTKPK